MDSSSSNSLLIVFERTTHICTGDTVFSLDEGTDDEEKKTLVGRLRGMIEVSLETLCRLFGRAPLSFRPYLPTFLTLSRSIIVDHGQRIATSGDLARRYEVPSLLACRFLSKCVAERKFEMLGDGDGDVTQEQVEGALYFCFIFFFYYSFRCCCCCARPFNR